MIHDILSKIQSELKAPKGQYNSFGKYSYRSCEDILEALKPLLAEHGATITISDTVEAVLDRIYIKATATLTAGGETIAVTAFAREEDAKKGMDASQVTGAASSYARKYALNGLFAIDDTNDSDTTNTGSKTKKDEGEPKEYKCCNCGKEFEPFTDKSGKIWSAGQVYHMAESNNTDGKARCKECSVKAGTRKAQ